MRTYTNAEIEYIAQCNGKEAKTVIGGGHFDPVELICVTMRFGVTAIFEMCPKTFDFSYSHTYNALTDKTTKRTPKIFV